MKTKLRNTSHELNGMGNRMAFYSKVVRFLSLHQPRVDGHVQSTLLSNSNASSNNKISWGHSNFISFFLILGLFQKRHYSEERPEMSVSLSN